MYKMTQNELIRKLIENQKRCENLSKLIMKYHKLIIYKLNRRVIDIFNLKTSKIKFIRDCSQAEPTLVDVLINIKIIMVFM